MHPYDAPELLTPSEMAMADSQAVALGWDGAGLMENAGRAVARAVRGRIAPCRVMVLCGPGNNGGDGYVAARHLQDAGWKVTVAQTAPPRGGAARMAAQCAAPRVACAPAEAAGADLLIDAVFGAGLDRDIDPAITAVLAAASRVVAVDVPSGLDGATGLPRGVVRAADITITFARRKPGHLLLPGRGLCGEVVLADIGLPPAAIEAAGARCFHNGPWLW